MKLDGERPGTPSLAEHSMRYNPLDAVARDPDNAWSEARLLADLLTGRRGPDEEGRNFITPAIFDVALGDRPERRHMRGVIARIACTDQQLEAWTATLARSPHRELVEHSRMLRELKPASRQALVNRLMRELAVWQTPPIADLIDRSDWTSDDLRLRATLYLCVGRHDLDRYAPVLRTIVGQTIAALSRDKAVSPSSGVTLVEILNILDGAGPLPAHSGTREAHLIASAMQRVEIKKMLREPVIIDARNLYDPDRLRELGIRYYSIGRPSAVETD